MAKLRIDISKTSSVKGLKHEIFKVADSYAIKYSALIRKVLEYAVENKDEYVDKLESPRQKPGEHMTAHIEPETVEHLNSWAKKLNTRRSNLVSYILQKTFENDSFSRILPIDEKEAPKPAESKRFKIIFQNSTIDKNDIVQFLTELNELYKSIGGDELVINESGVKNLNLVINPVYA